MNTPADQYICEDQSLDFDASTPEINPYLIPAGTYPALIKSAIRKRSKANANNEYVELRFEILDGAHKGSSIVSRLNIKNERETVTRMGKKALRQVCLSIGLEKLTSVKDLMNGKPLAIDVVVRPNQVAGYDATSEISHYAPISSATAAAAATAAPTAPTPVASWNPDNATDPDAI